MIKYMLDYDKEFGDDGWTIIFEDNKDNISTIEEFLSSMNSIEFYEIEDGYAINISPFAYAIDGNIELLLEKIKVDNRFQNDERLKEKYLKEKNNW